MTPQQSVLRLIETEVLSQIFSVVDQFNIFNAVGMVSQEIRHSTFLAFLLNPMEGHGLGETFLSSFLRSIFADSPGDSDPTETWHLSDARVDREWNFIDIRIRLPKERVIVLIENKVWTGEHSDQLARYYQVAQSHHVGWKIVPVYLTPGGATPSDTRYKAVRYSTVVELLEQLLSGPRFDAMNPDARVLLRHYVQLIRRNIVGGSELEELCKKTYLEHREAIDLINKYRPDTQSDMQQVIEELVSETQGVLILPPIKRQSKTYIKRYCLFIPLEWDKTVPDSATGTDNWTTKICNFVVCNQQEEVYILLQIRPGPEADRQRFYRIAESAGLASFPCVTKYVELRRWHIISPADFRTTTPATLQEIVRDGWNNFVANDLPQVVEVFRNGLNRQTY
ncbi:MAG: PD-(D/E)XK nuclease family protein [Armatimonadota bacterium]